MKRTDPENTMNYQQIFFVGNSQLDNQDFVRMVRGWENDDPSFKSVIVKFYSNCKKFDVPFSLESAAYYSMGSRNGQIRKDLPNYQLILTVSGEARIIYDNQEYISTPHTAMVVDCRLPHAYCVDENTVWEYKHIHFSANSQQSLLEESLGFTSDSGQSERFFDDLISYSRHESRTAPYVYSNIISSILTELVEEREKENQKADGSIQMEEIARYLRQNYTQDVSIQDIAQKYYLSVSHLIKRFKKYYGETPHQYLIRFRLNRAKELLMMGHTVEETAFSCGFGSLNNFYRAFKMSCMVTPKSFVSDIVTPPEEPPESGDDGGLT